VLRRRAAPLRAAAALVLLALAPVPASAWGFIAHRLVNRRAISLLPDPLRPLFEGNADYVSEHAVDPDLQRESVDDPNHFVDMDAFGAPPFGDIPHDEAAHLARHGAEARARGRLPWRTAEVYRDLVAAFRADDPARALQLAAELGHLVADGHVPLHATLNHDGQLTGQQGLHSRWESEAVERFQRQLEASLHFPAPARVDDPVESMFRALTDSYRHSLGVLASDKAARGERDLADTPEDDRYDDGYYSRFFELEEARLRERLELSVTATASFWTSAWEDAGRPAVASTFRFSYVRGRTRAVLVSLDGAAAGVIDDAVSRGVMPALARLRAGGAAASGSLTSLPAKTAAGHAALYTGAWSDRNGIGGNLMPVPGASVMEMQSGYSSTPLRAEPIWVTAARQDLDVSVVAAPQVNPFSTYGEDRRFRGYLGRHLTLIDAYQSLEAPDHVYRAAELPARPAGGWLGPLPAHEGEAREVELTVAGARVDGLLFDDPADPAGGLDTLYLTLDKDTRGGITLKPLPPGDGSAFAGLVVKAAGGDAAVYFRLYALASDGSDLLLYRTAPYVIRSNKPRLESAALEGTSGFVGNAAIGPYDRGELGARLWDGGDGTAEARYVETVALATRQATRLAEFAATRTAWHLLLAYLPFPDEALHLWLGRLDPRMRGHDPAVARRLRPSLDAVLRLADGFVGRLVERAPRDAVVAVATDHGMAAVDHLLRPNVALARAGWLGLDTEGKVDLARTRAVYFRGNSGYLLLNTAGRPAGIVRPEEEEAVRREVASTLRAIRDPALGGPLVLDVLDGREGAEPGRGGPSAGDLYLSLAPGVSLSAEATGALVEPITPRGEHMLDPERAELQGAFALAGDGVAAGVRLGRIRQIDVAPTLCALLGIDPPAQASGSVLAAALARPLPGRR
jgi:predicted AlkP superfamily phosphohydrolase/phosphomutase